jgi:hypothetical protein
MARNEVLVCDICKKETKKIIGKLHFIPSIPGVQKAVHSNYSHHLDVGACCKDRLLKGFNFRKRETAEEYLARRRGAA